MEKIVVAKSCLKEENTAVTAGVHVAALSVGLCFLSLCRNMDFVAC